MGVRPPFCYVLLVIANVYGSNYTVFLEKGNDVLTKRNPEFDGFSAYFAVRAETDRKGKSTPPARTETPTYQQQMSHHNISTHSAHEDGDGYVAGGPERSCHFNPLRPRGRRLLQTLNTFPMSRISTHSAHEDGDSSRFKSRPNSSYFNPLRPRGRRPSSCLHSRGNKTFQPTPPTRTETNICAPF